MPNQPTAKFLRKLMFDVNRVDDEVLDALDQYVSGKTLALPSPWDEDPLEFAQCSKEDLKAAIESERIFRATTLDDWLEIARDFYQDATGLKRRPKLLEDKFVTYLRLGKEIFGTDEEEFEPENFLNAVWLLGKDPKIDHSTFETLPWSLPDNRKYYSESDNRLCWEAYLSKAFGHFRKYRPPDWDETNFISFSTKPEAIAEQELEPNTVAHENCQPRIHMGKFEFAVYDFAMGLSRKTGECWLSRNTTGDWTGGMHPQTVRKKIDWLVANGWLVELKAPKAGRGGQGQYRAVDHAEWISKHGDNSCLRKLAENGESDKG